MDITEIRIKLVNNSREKLRAFASVTFDGDLVIRDLKIIEGPDGLFVAMPSRKLADRCPRCGGKNHLRARFCNDCGAKLNEQRAGVEGRGRLKLHADIAHPVNARCRERLQQAVVEAFHRELERAKLPGYKPASFEDLDEIAGSDEECISTPAPSPARRGVPQAGDERDFAADARRMDASFSDYDSLIADLKRSADVRRDRRGQERAEKVPAGNRAASAGRAHRGRRENAAESRPHAAAPVVPAPPPADPFRPQEPPPQTTGPGEAAAFRNDQEFGAGLF